MKPVKHNLVALGSAAVLAVYAAGYLRTKSAADRYLMDDSERRRIVATLEHAPDSQAPVVRLPEPAPAAAPVPSWETHESIPPKVVVAVVRKVVRPKAIDSTPAPQVLAATTAEAAPAPGDSSTQAAEKERGRFKDGRYSGWGTSRHGDIEATVEIRDGHIASAWISQCYTRYSCSWIAALPPQVVTRQSANVDYVSGATQSTNAFYYAVVEALAKAK